MIPRRVVGAIGLFVCLLFGATMVGFLSSPTIMSFYKAQAPPPSPTLLFTHQHLPFYFIISPSFHHHHSTLNNSDSSCPNLRIEKYQNTIHPSNQIHDSPSPWFLTLNYLTLNFPNALSSYVRLAEKKKKKKTIRPQLQILSKQNYARYFLLVPLIMWNLYLSYKERKMIQILIWFDLIFGRDVCLFFFFLIIIIFYDIKFLIKYQK